MASTATPYGMRPIGASGQSPYGANSVRQYRLTADNDIAIYTYGIVVMVAGAINGADTAPAAGTLSANSPLGICLGVQYTDPVLKYTLNGQYLPANCITAGYTNVLVSVYDDPNGFFMIQANGQVAQAEIGLNMTIATFTGNATTGFSTMAGNATAATTNTYPLRVVDLVNQNSIFGGGLSAPNDAYTDCIVRWNLNTHIWSFTTGQ
jgi:hypothetical protein